MKVLPLEFNGPLPQEMINQHDRAHGLHNHDRPGYHTGIMPAGHQELNLPAFYIHRVLLFEDGGNWLEDGTEYDWHPIRNSTLLTS